MDTWTGNWTLGRGIGHFDGTEVMVFSMKGKCKNETEVTSFSFLYFGKKSQVFFAGFVQKISKKLGQF